jgi:hypothetical protein
LDPETVDDETGEDAEIVEGEAGEDSVRLRSRI